MNAVGPCAFLHSRPEFLPLGQGVKPRAMGRRHGHFDQDYLDFPIKGEVEDFLDGGGEPPGLLQGLLASALNFRPASRFEDIEIIHSPKPVDTPFGQTRVAFFREKLPVTTRTGNRGTCAKRLNRRHLRNKTRDPGRELRNAL